MFAPTPLGTHLHQVTEKLHSLKLTARPYKWMVGIQAFPIGVPAYFQGLLPLVSGRVTSTCTKRFRYQKIWKKYSCFLRVGFPLKLTYSLHPYLTYNKLTFSYRFLVPQFSVPEIFNEIFLVFFFVLFYLGSAPRPIGCECSSPPGCHERLLDLGIPHLNLHLLLLLGRGPASSK